jgi:hypothetical protein
MSNPQTDQQERDQAASGDPGVDAPGEKQAAQKRRGKSGDDQTGGDGDNDTQVEVGQDRPIQTDTYVTDPGTEEEINLETHGEDPNERPETDI